jgi:hypothetical protein
MRTVQLILALLALVVVAAGCGSDKNKSDSSADTAPVTTAQTTQAPTTTATTTETTTPPAGSGNPASATPARAKQFEDCVSGKGRDIGGLNTSLTDTGFIVDLTVAQVYMFASPAKAAAEKADVASDNSGDKIVVKGDTVTAYDSINPDDQIAKTQSLVEGCV